MKPLRLAWLLAERMEEEGDRPGAALTVDDLLSRYVPYDVARSFLDLATKAEYDLLVLQVLADRRLTVLRDPAVGEAAEQELDTPEPGLEPLEEHGNARLRLDLAALSGGYRGPKDGPTFEMAGEGAAPAEAGGGEAGGGEGADADPGWDPTGGVEASPAPRPEGPAPGPGEPATGAADRAAQVAIVGGDGIGPEVVAEARRTLEAAREAGLASVELEDFPHGADHYLETGETLDEETFRRLRDDFDAILFGAVGDPRVPDDVHARDLLLDLRVRLDLYVNLRPLRLRDPGLSPLADVGRGIDVLVYRENTEGMYSGVGGTLREGTPEEVAVSEAIATRSGVERLVRAAFQGARSRGRERVTLAEKSNAVPHLYGLWRRVFGEVAEEYPDVEAETRYVDALAMQLVREPDRFDVIVAENLLGDIISDLGAELVGGPGLAPSANLHPDGHGLYEPIHGSAPDLAGSGRANPVAAILSAGLLLGELGFGEAADRVETVVDRALAEGVRTPDLGGDRTTGQVGRWIARRVRGDEGS